MPFGQFIIGPPGSGKSTYCHGMYQFLTAIKRPVAVINLDPANDALPYPCALDISELISLEDVMESLHLGPNGGLMYCMEYLEKNLDWLKEKLAPLEDKYLLFDCPGQAELYTHHSSMKTLTSAFNKWRYQICVVHLIDSHHCADPSNFISVLLVSLSSMCHLEMPHVNVLSKIDLLESYGRLAFPLSFFTDVLDLDYLLDRLDQDSFSKKHKALSAAICGIVEDYGLVSFCTLNITDKESVLALLKVVDKGNGFLYGQIDMPSDKSLLDLTQPNAEFDYDRNLSVQEKYMASSEQLEVERSARERGKEQVVPMSEKERQAFEKGLQEKQQQNLNKAGSSISGEHAAEEKTTMIPDRNCDHCGNSGASKRCGGCRSVFYCDNKAVCQKSAWRVHKKICKLRMPKTEKKSEA